MERRSAEIPKRLSHRQMFTCTSHMAFHCGSTTTAGPDLLAAKRRAWTRLFSGQGEVIALVKVRTRSLCASVSEAQPLKNLRGSESLALPPICWSPQSNGRTRRLLSFVQRRCSYRRILCSSQDIRLRREFNTEDTEAQRPQRK